MKSIKIRSSVTIPLGDAGTMMDFITFHGFASGIEHIAIRSHAGESTRPLVRIHSECLTGDVFGSRKCDCGEQLAEAIELIAAEGGYLLYLRQEGRGIGLYAKLDAYALQARGIDTFQANRMLAFPDDARDFACAAAMLAAMDVQCCRLLTNNPEKLDSLRAEGIDVVPEPTGIYLNQFNRGYIEAKVAQKQHTIAMSPCSAGGQPA